MDDPFANAQQRRAAIRDHAAGIGIDDAYIATLVDTFYSKIRSHEVLGPIFNDKIGDNWDRHLGRMKDFWASVALNAGRYSGRPVPVHQKLTNVQRFHFDIWLTLFRKTLEETAATPAAVDYFMERADRIAQSLQLAMFGLPELAGQKP